MGVAQGVALNERWVAEAKAGNLAGAIEAYVRAFDWVTFAELVKRLEPYAEVRGDLGKRIETGKWGRP